MKSTLFIIFLSPLRIIKMHKVLKPNIAENNTLVDFLIHKVETFTFSITEKICGGQYDISTL